MNKRHQSTHWSGTTMFDAVLSMGISTQAEHVRSLAVPALENLRREVQLVTFALEPDRLRARDQLGLPGGRRPRPHRGHAKVPDLEPALASEEDVGRLQVAVEDMCRVEVQQTVQ